MKIRFHIFTIIIFIIYTGLIQSKTPVADNNFVLQDNCSITADTISGASILVHPFYLEVIPPSSGVQFYRNGIIFLSFSKGDERIPEKHLSFGTVRTFMALVADSVPGPYMPFLSTSAYVFPSEATTFTSDYNTMYLSLIPEREKNEKIFKASYGQKGWVIDKIPLSFCEDNFIYTHPSLSSDGSFIVFSCDRTGFSGGLDLFVTRKVDDKWSYPENLGKNINTSGNELFASLDNHNNLYYSSDGMPGKGGFDIYMCSYNGKGWENPVSLPGDINSKEDEVAFTINRNDGKTAFYTSRSKTGKNRIQLYYVAIGSEPGSQNGSGLTDRFFAQAGVTKSILGEQTASIMNKDIPVPEIMEPAANKESVPSTKLNAQPANIKTETKPIENIPPDLRVENNENLIYRIQILANTRPIGSNEVTISGKKYQTYEYLYKGGYRTTVGEFETLTEAIKFQNLCRQNGYSQAFIAAFLNNNRITDAEAREIETGRAVKQSTGKEKHIDAKPSESRTTYSSPSQGKKDIVYRVQLLANMRPVGTYNISIGDQDYQTFEYYFMGGYRTSIGEFDILSDATRLQNLCRKAGYDQAFVVAFKNGKRTNDPALFK